jgi:hypothetical protein
MRDPKTRRKFMVTPISRLRRLIPAAGLYITVAALAAAAALALPSPTPSEACPPIDPPAATPLSAPSGATSAAAGKAGLRVSVDPATGKIRRATTEERRRIAATRSAARDRSGRTYEVRTRSDGTRVVKLDETFLMSVVARTHPDGTVSYQCRTESAPAAAGSAVAVPAQDSGQ